ncbi:hypothetical protein [Kordia sp.]|uniref:hypothetical protein n=1 Tax=Kordia sp. TaxID=1965332 RepID=UPI0025C582C4|nr:hypothetical protein [Kordia sp.]MCH2192576.1 hypothetical protein [Kordia sp.]
METIDGYSYSYITGTITDYLRSIHSQFYRQSKFEVRMFSLGVILYDKNGAVEKLKEKASVVMELDFESPTPDLFTLKKYMLFNHFIKIKNETNLRKYHYFQFLDHIFKAYSFYIGFEIPSIEKLDRILFDKTYRSKNNFTAFPDKTFFKLWEEAVNVEEKYFTETVKQLYEHLEGCWGKFDADDFKTII